MSVQWITAGPESLIAVFAARLATAVVVTSADLGEPGPTILYVNAAFARLTGYEPHELVGRSPRIVQGPRTRTEIMRNALSEADHCHVVVTNYRKSGEPYLCEIDIRPVHDATGAIQVYVAFEREVVRRRGRPRAGDGGRFDVVDENTSDELPDVFRWTKAQRAGAKAG